MTQPYPCPYPCPSPGAMEELPEKTHAVAEGVQLRIALVHPTWSTLLLATNEALEVQPDT